jgi:tetratricopeptide (TPR) repeat protein
MNRLSQCYARSVRSGSKAVEGPWERGRQAMQRSVELAKTGEIEQALGALDGALAQATQDNRGIWIKIICRHAAVLAHAIGDRRREIQYTEQALPYARDYRFAVYNFAQLLLIDGQVGRAERYATEAYELSVAEGTEADRDLAAAILKQWPNIAENR